MMNRSEEEAEEEDNVLKREHVDIAYSKLPGTVSEYKAARVA